MLGQPVGLLVQGPVRAGQQAIGATVAQRCQRAVQGIHRLERVAPAVARFHLGQQRVGRGQRLVAAAHGQQDAGGRAVVDPGRARVVVGPEDGRGRAAMRQRIGVAAQHAGGQSRAMVRPGLGACLAADARQAQALQRHVVAPLRVAAFGEQGPQVRAGHGLEPACTGFAAFLNSLQHQVPRALVAAQGHLDLPLVDPDVGHAAAVACRLVGVQRLLVVGQGLPQVVGLHEADAQVDVDGRLGVQVAGGEGLLQALQGVGPGFVVPAHPGQAHGGHVVHAPGVARCAGLRARQALLGQRDRLLVARLHEQAPDSVVRQAQAQHIVVRAVGQRFHDVDLAAVRGRVARAQEDVAPHAMQAHLARQVGAVIQRQRAIGLGQGRDVGMAARGILGGAQPPREGQLRIAGALIVLGDLAGQFVLAALAAALQPARGLGVRVALVGLEHGAVGHLVQQVVAKAVFACALERAVGLRQRQFAPAQFLQLVG